MIALYNILFCNNGKCGKCYGCEYKYEMSKYVVIEETYLFMQQYFIYNDYYDFLNNHKNFIHCDAKYIICKFEFQHSGFTLLGVSLFTLNNKYIKCFTDNLNIIILKQLSINDFVNAIFVTSQFFQTYKTYYDIFLDYFPHECEDCGYVKSNLFRFKHKICRDLFIKSREKYINAAFICNIPINVFFSRRIINYVNGKCNELTFDIISYCDKICEYLNEGLVKKYQDFPTNSQLDAYIKYCEHFGNIPNNDCLFKISIGKDENALRYLKKYNFQIDKKMLTLIIDYYDKNGDIFKYRIIHFLRIYPEYVTKFVSHYLYKKNINMLMELVKEFNITDIQVYEEICEIVKNKNTDKIFNFMCIYKQIMGK